MKEEWRPITGYEGCYEVSNFGRVRSLTRLLPFGGGVGLRQGRTCKPETCHAGHRRIRLHKEGRGARFFVHRLVLGAFVGPCPIGMEAAHNDNDPTNNKVSNLRWDTRSGNHQDKHKFGTFPVGEKASRSILTEDQVRQIMFFKGTISQAQLAENHGVCPQTISAIHRGKSWSHLFAN